MSTQVYIGYYLKIKIADWPTEEYESVWDKFCPKCQKVKNNASGVLFCCMCGTKLEVATATRKCFDICDLTNDRLISISEVDGAKGFMFVLPNNNKLGGLCLDECSGGEYKIPDSWQEIEKAEQLADWVELEATLEYKKIPFERKTGLLWYWN